MSGQLLEGTVYDMKDVDYDEKSKKIFNIGSTAIKEPFDRLSHKFASQISSQLATALR